MGFLGKVIHPPSAKHRVGYFFILSISNTTNVTNEIINIAVGMSIGFPLLIGGSIAHPARTIDPKLILPQIR